MIVALLTLCIAFIFALGIDIGSSYSLEWFMFGLYFKVDTIAKTFLLFSTFVWLISGIYAYFRIQEGEKAFWFWFMLTFLGNFALCMAADALSFYLFFTLMSLSAFGLILHNKSKEALLAAFVYIRYAIVAEVALFVVVLYSYGITQKSFELVRVSETPPIIAVLIALGFGIKVGMFLLHSWLPSAHAQAPAPASAVLSGVMLKAGVLGWIRMFDSLSSEWLGYIFIVFGFLGIFGGFYGLTQRKIKVVLAYSSISQMGFIVVLFGLSMVDASSKELLLHAILFFSIHHALNKSALFLLSAEILKEGLDKTKLALVLFFALSLVGVVFTSGALAKDLMLEGVNNSFIRLLLSLGACVTALLMVHFILLSRQIQGESVASLYALHVSPLLLASFSLYFLFDESFSFSWSALFALAFALLFFVLLRATKLSLPAMKAGDMLMLFRKFSFHFPYADEEETHKMSTHPFAKLAHTLEKSILQESFVYLLLLTVIALLSIWIVLV